ncbi:ribosome maturation factor RimM [Brumimicrobium aurantiacum]|uniref:Ribosome maturation factor RimM n=1 Tax=Brumimicrobium aurantiacum TaxID=1737063 RepID=A0A3E1EYV8_9FLAO|nr:ribosome maturation factor RimM [Brumimicrobium aurantiacum]RFC54750.1 16S rRNA processing protein RimM [Brumimicrobium aurantiacum]
MNKADCFNLGYVAKLHSYKGEVSLFFDATDPEKYANLDAVFIDVDGILTPFFVEKITMKDKGFAKVKFEGVDSEKDARIILKKELFLPLQVLPELTGKHFYDHEIIGFAVIDEVYGEVGEVVQVLDYKINPLLQVQNTQLDKEVLLPLGNDLVQKVDREKKELHVKATAGLIEMYLES